MKLASRPLLLALMFTFGPISVLAGPPFQTDDPEPVDFRHYEFYIFGGMDGTPVEIDPTGPALEFNWGAAPRLQLHAVLPLGAIIPSNNPIYLPGGTGPSAYGLIDTEMGVKYEWVTETKYRPMIGTFTMLEVPTGSYARGLGVGRPWFKLPVWVQKDQGPWTTYGGAGYEIVPQTQYRNFAYEGWLVQRDIGKRWTLGVEVFHHGREGFATPQTEASTLVDFGGYYYFKKPAFQLLFCYGHSVYGQTENYAYLGLYWTWGSKAGKGLNGFFAHHLSPH
ncbi:MAG: transporter [Terriglobia bacterium]